MVSDLGCSEPVEYTADGTIFAESQCCEQYVFMGIVLYTQCQETVQEVFIMCDFSAWLAGRGNEKKYSTLNVCKFFLRFVFFVCFVIVRGISMHCDNHMLVA